MICKRCGKCCESTFFALRDVPVDQDTREIGRWASYHGVKVGKYKIDGIEYLSIQLPGKCEHLEESNNIKSCKIYDKRPKVCQEYFCSRVKLEEEIRTMCSKFLEEKEVVK